MVLQSRPNNMTAQEISKMNATTSDHGFSHRSNFCKPKALRIYRCRFDNCNEIISPHGLEKNVKVHFAQQHKNLSEPLLAKVEKGGQKRVQFLAQPKKKGKKDTGKEEKEKQQPKAKPQDVEQKAPIPNDSETNNMEFDDDEEEEILKNRLLTEKVTDENEKTARDMEGITSQKSNERKDHEGGKTAQKEGKGETKAKKAKGGTTEQNQENQPIRTNVQRPIPRKRLRKASGPFKQRRQACGPFKQRRFMVPTKKRLPHLH